MSREPESDPCSVQEWAEIASPDATTNDIITVFHRVVRAWLGWGAEHAATATMSQNQKTIDAIVLQETGYKGIEPTGLASDDRLLRMAAQAYRAQLELLSGAELANQCRVVLAEASDRAQNLATLITQQQRERSRAASERALIRYRDYRPALVELARSRRQVGLKARAVGKDLLKQPFVARDGTKISFVDRRGKGFFIVSCEGKPIREIRESTFCDDYWPLAK